MKNEPFTITPELLSKMEASYDAVPAYDLLSSSISSISLTEAAFVPVNAAKLRMDFSIEVPTTGITAQKQSGRCWMFATMNLIRERVIQNLNLKEFALSGTYLAFYDKLEKGNNFYEAVLHYADQPLDSRENAAVFANCCADGGQWDMAVGLLRKYGVVPDWVMPETAHSTGTAAWRDIIAEKLRQDGLELRRLHNAGQDTTQRRAELLQELYNALCILYGKPTRVFDFEYTDKKGVYHCDRSLTPKEFYQKYIGDDLDQYTCIITSPVHEFNRTYSQPFMGDIIENQYHWLNLSMEEVEDLSIRQLKSGEGVMFSCDSNAYKERAKGFWAPECFQYGKVLGFELSMNKKERMEAHSSFMTHCMMLCGVNLDENGKPDRWKIENSWGEANGQKGYYICSESWFQGFVYQVVVRKDLLSPEQLALLDQEPIPMTFWDPLA